MILHSIEVQGWRCFARPVELTDFATGLNVLHAPNGTGKSTLLEALARAFFDRHTTSGEEAETLRPWGREVAPVVTVTFQCHGDNYRVTKQFLDSPRCVLELLDKDGRYTPVASGPQAAERLRLLLMGSAPGHGLCDTRHWGLAQVLWAPQGDLALGELPDTLVGHVQASLSAQLAAAGSGEIEQRIEQLFATFFTPTGRVRSGALAPPLAALEQELRDALAERDRLHALLEDYSRASEDVIRLAQEKERITASILETENALTEARARAQARSGLAAKADSASAAVRAAEAEFMRLSQTVEAMAAARRDAAVAAREAERFTAQLGELEKAERRLEAERQTARAGLEAAEQTTGPAELEELLDAARAWAEATRRREELIGLERRAAELEAERKELARMRTDLAPAPDRRQLAAIREAVRRRDSAAARLEAALITLTLEPAPEASPALLSGAKVILGDRPEPGTPLGLLPGEAPVVIQGAPEVAVEIPGFGRIVARGPADSVDQLRRTMAEAESEVAELTVSFGTHDLARLEEREAVSQSLAIQHETAVNTLAAIVAPFSGKGRPESLPGDSVTASLAVLGEELARENERLEEILARHPDWKTSPPDPAELQRRLDDLTAARHRDLTERRARVTAAEEDHRRAHDALVRARSGSEHAEARAREAERRLAALLAGDAAGTPGGGNGLAALSAAERDADRHAKLNRLAMDRAAALQCLEDAREELRALADAGKPDGKSPESLEAFLGELRDLQQQAVADEARRQGELARLVADAPYSRLAEAEERVAELEFRVADERQRMEAVRLLYHTAESCRRSAFETVLEPVQRSATELFRNLVGDRLGPVRLGSCFAVRGVIPDGLGDPVDPRHLSGGEREQLHFAVRLALARELARAERRLFVLDDALTATDRRRHARVRALLAEAAENGNLQVLVLTCQPEAYEEWRDAQCAKFFDLPALMTAREQAGPPLRPAPADPA